MCVVGDGVRDLPVSAGEVSGRREASVAESGGRGVGPQTVCAATPSTVRSAPASCPH